MTELGFDVLAGDHPIVPVMIGDAARAGELAEALVRRGVYVADSPTPWCRSGRPASAPRSAAHTIEDLELAVEQFRQARDELG
jgi:glycine C-acetyltransferase